MSPRTLLFWLVLGIGLLLCGQTMIDGHLSALEKRAEAFESARRALLLNYANVAEYEGDLARADVYRIMAGPTEAEKRATPLARSIAKSHAASM